MDISNGEGPFMVRAAQVPRMMANRFVSCLAMIHGFNQMASRPSECSHAGAARQIHLWWTNA
jgi:hypothetical protein